MKHGIYDILQRIQNRRSGAEPFLFIISLTVYLMLIFDKLTAFPIYFFCDEAVAGVDAYSLLTQGTDMFGNSYPLFFQGLGDYALSLSVYLQLPFIRLFGLNEFAVRLTTAVISLIGVSAVYVLLRYIFKLQTAWMTFVVFAVSPVWFLHSRTGFEYLIAVAFFLAFGVLYILTFSRHPAFVVPAAICAAATFYAYTPGRGWILVSLLVLFFINILEHIRYWKRLLIGVGLLLVLLSPYILLHIKQPDIATKRLQALDYQGMFQYTTWSQQTAYVLKNYAVGLNPLFWYTWENTENIGPMERHVIPPLSPLLAWAFPFFCVGAFLLLLRLNALENRTLLALLLASPLPASLIRFNIHRGLPVGVFMLVVALLGFGWMYNYIAQRSQSFRRIVPIAMLFSLSLYAIWFRIHVHTIAPYSYRNYGFYGLQMGAPQVFRWIQEHGTQYHAVYLAHNLFNSGDIFIPFYLDEEHAQKTSILAINGICKPGFSFPENAVYILPLKDTSNSHLTCPIRKNIISFIPDITGNPLFEIVQLGKAATFEVWLKQEEKRRGKLQTRQIEFQRQRIRIEHPVFDIGNVQSLFDRHMTSLARTDRINPARLIIHIPPTQLKQLSISVSHIGSAELRVTTFSNGHKKDWGVQQYVRSQKDFGTIIFEQMESIADVTTINIIVRVTDMDKNGFVHINEIGWK